MNTTNDRVESNRTWMHLTVYAITALSLANLLRVMVTL